MSIKDLKNDVDESSVQNQPSELNVEELITTIRYKIQRALEKKAEKTSFKDE